MCHMVDMVAITFRIPKSVVKRLDILVNSGMYASKSEIIREAVRDVLYKQALLLNVEANWKLTDKEREEIFQCMINEKMEKHKKNRDKNGMRH